MAASGGFKAGENLRVHLIDVVIFLESGDHDCNSFDFTFFRLDCVLNVLTRNLDIHGTGVGSRTLELVRQAMEVVNATVDHDTDPFQAEVLFLDGVGGEGQMLLESSWNFSWDVDSTPHKLLPF